MPEAISLHEIQNQEAAENDKQNTSPQEQK